MKVTLVTGPPCSGKTLYVSGHMQPGDIVLDYDALAVALGSPDSHDHPDGFRMVLFEARRAILARLRQSPDVAHAWLVKCDPAQDEYALHPEVVTLETSRDECHRRADAAARPARWHALIDQWFDARNL